MKDILNVIKENATARLKNHLVGSYLFSWVVCHLKTILIFIMSSSEKQLELISNAKFEPGGDLFMPLIFMAVYLFVLPFFNLQYERFFYFLQRKRNKIKNNYLVGFYSAVTESNHAKVKSDESHIKEVFSKELDGWATQKKSIIELKFDYSKKTNARDMMIKNHEGQNALLQKKLDSITMLYERLRDENGKNEAFLANNLDSIESLLKDEDEALVLIGQIRSKLNLSEEIPF